MVVKSSKIVIKCAIVTVARKTQYDMDVYIANNKKESYEVNDAVEAHS